MKKKTKTDKQDNSLSCNYNSFEVPAASVHHSTDLLLIFKRLVWELFPQFFVLLHSFIKLSGGTQ